MKIHILRDISVDHRVQSAVSENSIHFFRREHQLTLRVTLKSTSICITPASSRVQQNATVIQYIWCPKCMFFCEVFGQVTRCHLKMTSLQSSYKEHKMPFNQSVCAVGANCCIKQLQHGGVSCCRLYHPTMHLGPVLKCPCI